MYDYILVGQGLAGTLMAFSLWKQNFKVLVIDECKSHSASMVAGGIYNPVTGRRLVKSWIVDDLLPIMEQTYMELEGLLEVRLLYPKKILRLLNDPAELETLTNRKADLSTNKYLGEIQNTVPVNGLKEFRGCCEIIGGGWVNTNLLINTFREFLKSNELFYNEKFDYSQVQITPQKVNYKGYHAKKLIFCEGYEAIHNPFFSNLPFKLVKGEILTIHCPGLSDEFILNKGIIIMPLGNGMFKAGSTYNWDDLTEKPTGPGKMTIIEKITEILAIPYTVINHEAGVRPAIKDRRPVLGSHPDFFEKLYVFNGLGTKGVLLAPWLAKVMTNHLTSNYPIHNEVSIDRF